MGPDAKSRKNAILDLKNSTSPVAFLQAMKQMGSLRHPDDNKNNFISRFYGNV